MFYWRERNRKVDFVVRAGRRLTAIEVKSGRATDTLPGMEAFASAFKPQRKLLVGGAASLWMNFFISLWRTGWVRDSEC